MGQQYKSGNHACGFLPVAFFHMAADFTDPCAVGRSMSRSCGMPGHPAQVRKETVALELETFTQLTDCFQRFES
ncbi:hypothetical protein A3J34_00420 [Candidatus Peribacteria bacterium RIFCSPLOWO2_02_FULL_51_10]|nr:MAG: hypothetical protein A3J34_00420 [Candidatus Peribacteria bacterium RIFCSPLOWO2_02_FULL_51_10]